MAYRPEQTQQVDPFDTEISKMRGFSRAVELSLVLLSLLACSALYWLAATDARTRLETEAATYAELVLTARLWNSTHQSVYVVKTPQAGSNLYLKDLGIDPDVVTTDGVELTMRNPAAMTREISELTSRTQGARFKITSLQPVNPNNAPDAWEEEALKRFETEPVPSATVKIDGSTEYYHYLVPLLVDDSCLTCHKAQGYEAGDVRGGLDVSIPYGPTRTALTRYAWIFGLLAVVSSAGLVTAFGTLFGRYQRRLEDAGSKLQHLATVDSLTQLPNRRTARERLRAEMERARRAEEPLCVIGIDIDFFKRVNDQAGHAAGDEVLVEVARRMTAAVREYDVVARMGGEEFVVIAPTTDASEGTALAERILQASRSDPFQAGGLPFDITLSAGVATLQEDDTSDTFLDRADKALYLAKGQGRNRVVES